MATYIDPVKAAFEKHQELRCLSHYAHRRLVNVPPSTIRSLLTKGVIARQVSHYTRNGRRKVPVYGYCLSKLDNVCAKCNGIVVQIGNGPNPQYKCTSCQVFQ